MRDITISKSIDPQTFCPTCRIMLGEEFTGISFNLELMNDIGYTVTMDDVVKKLDSMITIDVTAEEREAIINLVTRK